MNLKKIKIISLIGFWGGFEVWGWFWGWGWGFGVGVGKFFYFFCNNLFILLVKNVSILN